jgi:hypothetical protein
MTRDAAPRRTINCIVRACGRYVPSGAPISTIIAAPSSRAANRRLAEAPKPLPASSYSHRSDVPPGNSVTCSGCPGISPVCCTTGCPKTNAPPRTKSGIDASVTGTVTHLPPVWRWPLQ